MIRQMVVLMVLVGVGFSIASSQGARWSIDQLAWISGCWDGSRGNRESMEQWMKPSGKTILGMSRTVVNGKTVEFEFLQIREGEDGVISYIAKPSRQAETSFRLVALSDKEAVFENPEHDFPQRIIYRLQPDGSLHARIEGKSKGKDRGVDFLFKWTNCQ